MTHESKTHNEDGEEYEDARERRLFDEAMTRTAQRLEGVNLGLVDDGDPLKDAAIFYELLKKLGHNMDVMVMSKGYHFIVSVQKGHEVFALTSGDHHYEPTGLNLDMCGWEVCTEDKNLQAEGSWNRLWKFYVPALSGRAHNQPEIHEVVVTKTPGGVIAYDWLETTRYPNNTNPFFAENHGSVQFWMTVEEFEKNAPQWAQEHSVKLTEEAIAAHARLVQGTAGDAEGTL